MKKYLIEENQNNELYNFQIFTSCDQRYFDEFAIKFLTSVNVNSPGNKVVLHIINPDNQFDSKIREIRQNLKSIDITIIKETIDLSHLSKDEKVTYYATARFELIGKYFVQSKIDTYLCDIDSYVIKDIFILRREYESFDLTIHFRLNLEYNRRLLAGSIFIRYNKNTVNFLNELSDRFVKKGLKNKWMADQIMIYETLIKHVKHLKICNLDKKYIDWRMGNNSVIWSAKGDKKETPKFVEYGNWLIGQYYQKADICILAPRVDHSFKSHIGDNKLPIIYADMEERIKDPIRIYWLYYAKILTYFLRKAGHKVELIIQPQWFNEKEYIKNLPHKIIYVPHKSYHQIIDERCIFYMQELYPYFFTIDRQGWGASSSKYKKYDYINSEITPRLLEEVDNIKNNKISKYPQLKSKKKFEFDIFFPLQIPHDQTLQFHSKYGLKEIVEFIIKWAVKNKIKILFKKHPYDRKMNYLDQSIVDPEYIKIVREGDVHDYIKQAKAVFVANSGVGFEAMLYNKPIITFAQAIYDMVTFNCDIRDHDLTEIYQRATDQSIRSLEIEYSKFMSWYLFEEGTNISGERLNINLAIERFDNIENPFYRDIKNLLNSSKNEDCNKELIESGKRDGLIGFSKLFRFCKI